MAEPVNLIFSPNPAIDFDIKERLQHLDLGSQQRIRRALLNARRAAEAHLDENTDSNARHIFRELIPASMLNQFGFKFEYDVSICGMKPDWVDFSAGILLESYTYERGGTSSFYNRLSSVIGSKCHKYSHIAKQKSLRIVIAVHLDFLSDKTLNECQEDSKLFKSIFESNEALSALLFFSETQFVQRRQEYGFVCVSMKSRFDHITAWPFTPHYIDV